MVSFVNFARIASICVGFHLGRLHGYFFHQDFWPNMNFPLEYQIKLVLICRYSETYEAPIVPKLLRTINRVALKSIGCDALIGWSVS